MRDIIKYRYRLSLMLRFALFLIVTQVFPQHGNIDSLQRVLGEVDQDTSRISLLLVLSKAYQSKNLDSFDLLARQALKISQKNKDYKLAEIYNKIGLSHIYKSETDSAHHFFDEALRILDLEDNKEVRAMVYANYSMSYHNSDDFEEKANYNLKAIELVKDNKHEVCRLYFNHAVMLANAGFTSQAKKYLRLAYKNSQSSGNNLIEAVTLKALTYYATTENKLDSAQYYLDRGLVLCKTTKSPQICFEIHSKLGEFYGDLKRYGEANAELSKAKEYALARNKIYDIMVTNITLGNNELKRGHFVKSASYFAEFDRLYQENPFPDIGLEAYRSWAEVEKQKKNYEKSNRLLEKYVAIKDSVYSNENRLLLADVNTRYETEKKDKELAEQQLQLQEQANSILKKEKQYNQALAGALLLFFAGLGGWLYYRQRQKIKSNEIMTLKAQQDILKLEALIEGEEKERVRLAQDLHDGINGDLAVIKYKITSLNPTEFKDKEKEAYSEAINMLDNAVDQVRRISHNLAPPSLHNFDLTEAIKQYCNKVASANPIHIDFQFYGNDLKLEKETETVVYRMVQELVNNAIKHARAKEVLVQINHREYKLDIVVEDDGIGFDASSSATGIGLQNVRSRVNYLKGELDIDSGKGGSSIRINIDLNKLKTA
ncbi:MAG: ATP-binding protein [Flavobacteriaceae bacterium]